MSRKPLDLELLNKSLENQANPQWDRDTRRAYQVATSMVSDIDKFEIVELQEDEVLLTAVGASLPTDEEIDEMKRQLAERDRMEMEKQVSSVDRLPWWRRIINMMGLSR